MSAISKGALLRVTLVVVAFIAVFALLISSHLNTGHVATHSQPAHVATFPAQHLTWVISQDMPSNAIIHWHEYSQVGLSTSTEDPGAGKIISADKWVETGAEDSIIFSHTIYTLPDGSLYQDHFNSSSTSIIVRGPAYITTDGSVEGGSANPFWCVSKSAAQQSTGGLFYIAPQNLAHDGFTSATRTLARPIPSDTDALTNAHPAQTLVAPTNVTSWQGTGIPQKGTGVEHSRFDVDATGRIIVSEIDHNAPDGTLTSVQWYSIGTVSVYPATTALPAWVNAVPPQVTKGC